MYNIVLQIFLDIIFTLFLVNILFSHSQKISFINTCYSVRKWHTHLHKLSILLKDAKELLSSTEPQELFVPSRMSL